MKPQNKLKRKKNPNHHTYKTKDAFVDDFVRWLKEKNALKKHIAEKQIANTNRDSAQALMVWADDGGITVRSQPLSKKIEQILAIKEKKS